ncbi:DlpA domain-containing protein [Delitschia confertaspora ATCC 74209]|uniref:DlpA domain-containing protein n=1 Tax=Delitschia confertaspora ATCC 74209 TaxID=1513339 RepID=A0A9P4JH05_9PLEO|nr:DlpA domain-containing protein [Delitschia confertaspora ATCC 74209]
MSSPKWKSLHQYSACDIADALLKLKVPGAGFLADISPLRTSKPSQKTIAPATTILFLPKSTPSFPLPTQTAQSLSPSPPPPSNLGDNPSPFADYTSPGSIVVISQPLDQICAVVGGIMGRRMRELGATGVVVNGRVRDLKALEGLGMPIWSRGTSIIGAGAETKLHAYNVPITLGSVVVEPGDIIFADPDENGVVCIPKGKVNEVLELLPKLVKADEKVMEDVERGVSVKESFKRHRSAL